MKGTFVLLVLLVMASAGCNLSLNIVDNPPASPSPTRSQPILEVPTNRVLTATPLPSPTVTVVQPTPLPNCTPRADWPLYSVAVGDMLGQIAVRSGTSTATLIQANCLTNANLISVGQMLHVPRQPTPPTAKPPTLTPTLALQNMGSLSISTYVTGDAGNFELISGKPVTIKWDFGPTDAIRTDFFRRGNDGTMTLIGSDGNGSDGLTTTWIAEANFSGTFTASAIRVDGSHLEPFFKPIIYVYDINSPANTIKLDTYLRIEGDTYFVRANQPITLSWTGAPPTDDHVEFKFTPIDHSKQPYLLGSDTNLSDGLASIGVTFAPGDQGVISASSYRRDSPEPISISAKAVTINVPAPEATAEPTAEATQAS